MDQDIVALYKSINSTNVQFIESIDVIENFKKASEFGAKVKTILNKAKAKLCFTRERELELKKCFTIMFYFKNVNTSWIESIFLKF